MGRHALLLKILLFASAVVLASWLTQTQYTQQVIGRYLPFWMILVFIAGLFYTSFLTVPFSLVGFYILSQHVDILPVVLLGGLGAMFGDLFIVNVFRNLFSSFTSRKTLAPFFKRLSKVLHKWHLDFVAILIGSVIIASPLPDELGLILIGASGLSYPKLMALSFVLNSIGIFIIVAPAYLFL